MATFGVAACDSGSDTLQIDTDEAALAPVGSNAMMIAHDVPAVMTPGETRQVTVTMRNSGIVAWASTNWILRNRGQGTWSQQSVSVVPTVSPGQSFTFVIMLRAPTVEGTFNFGARMMYFGQGYFGDVVSIPVSVTGVTATPLGSRLVSQNAPLALYPGEKRRVHAILENTGSREWNATFDLRRAAGAHLAWVSTPVNTTVPNGQMHDFSFVIAAPDEEAPATLVARMYVNDGASGLFGATLTHAISVSSEVNPERWWAEMGETVPMVMVPSARSTFTITVQNVGTVAWSGANYALSVNSTPRASWTRRLVRLGANETIEPGDYKVFEVSIDVPAVVGAYNLNWQMTELGAEGVETFGPLATQEILIGLPPPVDTTLITVPADPSCEKDATFEFASESDSPTFECSLDGAPYTECVSPLNVGSLEDGQHFLIVRAIAGGLTDETPALYAWYVDTRFAGSFEEGFFCWTIADAPAQPEFAVWTSASTGQTLSAGDVVYDYADDVMVTLSSPGLPMTYEATDGQQVAVMVVGGASFHRMYQETTVPECATLLVWDMLYRNLSPAGWDATNQFLRVSIKDTNDNLLATYFDSEPFMTALSAPMSTYGGDVSAFVGQRVRIDVSANTQTFFLDLVLDNFRFLGCD